MALTAKGLTPFIIDWKRQHSGERHETPLCALSRTSRSVHQTGAGPPSGSSESPGMGRSGSLLSAEASIRVCFAGVASHVLKLADDF